MVNKNFNSFILRLIIKQYETYNNYFMKFLVSLFIYLLFFARPGEIKLLEPMYSTFYQFVKQLFVNNVRVNEVELVAFVIRKFSYHVANVFSNLEESVDFVMIFI